MALEEFLVGNFLSGTSLIILNKPPALPFASLIGGPITAENLKRGDVFGNILVDSTDFKRHLWPVVCCSNSRERRTRQKLDDGSCLYDR